MNFCLLSRLINVQGCKEHFSKYLLIFGNTELLYFLIWEHCKEVFDKQNNQNTALQLFNFPKILLNAKENRFIPLKDGMYISTTH